MRGAHLLRNAGTVVYAGSLVNPALLSLCPDGRTVYNSAEMTLEQVVDVLVQAEGEGKSPVRLHTGDPSLYGAIREQMDALDALNVPYDVIPGVSSLCAAAAALPGEYTLPGITQSVIITRMAGRTSVPQQESVANLAEHGCSMVVFFVRWDAAGTAICVVEGRLHCRNPRALIYKASWPEERVCRCTLGTLAQTGHLAGITKTALVLVGEFFAHGTCAAKQAVRCKFFHGISRGRTMNCSEDFSSGNIELIAFTSQGFALAQRLAEMLGRNGFALWGIRITGRLDSALF